jgi:hypothetical protein
MKHILMVLATTTLSAADPYPRDPGSRHAVMNEAEWLIIGQDGEPAANALLIEGVLFEDK